MTKILTVHRAALECEEINPGHCKTWPTGLLPLMTWADWELLQELHKARNGEGTATVCFHNPDASEAPGHNPDLFPSYDKQYESLAPRSSGPENPTFGCRQVALPAVIVAPYGGAPSGKTGGSGAGGKPEMNWQAVAADLQDQIKDWETKCRQLEGSLSVAVQLKDDAMRQNAELSKSLQHYRNAYFADQGKEGNSDGQK